MGAVGIGLMVLSALAASSANTKPAEARSSSARAVTSHVVAAAPAPAAPVVLSSALSDPQPASSARASAVAPHETITPPPPDLRLEDPRLRRMQKAEITPEMLLVAARIVRTHHAKPVGTTIAVDVDGKRIVARIERHFHPEGGAVKPWGLHPGVSLFIAR